MDKLTLALTVATRRLQPYFRAPNVKVLTNFPLKQVFQKCETSGRLMKWALELSEYDISFEPRVAMKGQVVVDFIVELTLLPNPGEENLSRWVVDIDRSSNEKGGARVPLQAPSGDWFKYTVRFNFAASNNEVEYEALIACLHMGEAMGATRLDTRRKSQPVVTISCRSTKCRSTP